MYYCKTELQHSVAQQAIHKQYTKQHVFFVFMAMCINTYDYCDCIDKKTKWKARNKYKRHTNQQGGCRQTECVLDAIFKLPIL